MLIEQNPEIEPHRLMVDIPHIERESLVPAKVVPPVYLGPPGDPGSRLVPAHLRLGVVGQVLAQQWTRPDQAHVTLETFQSSGNSSRLVVRSQRPKGVSRSSSGSGFPSGPEASIIVRNLTRAKGWPCSPGRFCRNRIGRPTFRRTNSATTRPIVRPHRSGKDHQSQIEASLADLASLRFGACGLPGSLVTRRHATTLPMVAAIRSIVVENEKRSA